MTTGTLPSMASTQLVFFTGANFAPEPKKGHWYAKADGTQAYRMEHVAIFRSGEFRDSMGYDHLYEDLHMQMIASNFSLLRGQGALPDPPIRCDHPSLFGGGILKNVIGYVDNLVAEKATSPVDGTEYTYIFADYDILDPEAAQKVASGLWRHRSAEIGWYETNAKAEFWPVLVGFAYVDIPAVEGLNFSKYANALPGAGQNYVAVAADNKEDGLVAEDKNAQTGTTPPPPSGQAAPPPPPPPAGDTAPPASTTGNVQPTATHSTGAQTHSFSIRGQATTDFAAVQAHVTELEQFEAETLKTGREAFVDGLASTNKIFAGQVDSLKELALSMSAEQFDKFKASYADAPELSVLANHSTQPGASGTPEGSGGHEDPEIEAARRNYNRHLQMNLTAGQIEQTDSYKLLKSKNLI